MSIEQNNSTNDDLDKKIAILQEKLEGLPKQEKRLKRNMTVQENVWNYSLKPLVVALIEKIQKFETICGEVVYVMIAEGIEKSYSPKELLIHTEKQFYRNEHLEGVKIIARLNEFQSNGVTVFPVYQVILQCRISNYEYDVCCEALPEFIVKTFDQNLSEEEVHHLVSSSVDSIYAKIDKQLKNLPQ